MTGITESGGEAFVANVLRRQAYLWVILTTIIAASVCPGCDSSADNRPTRQGRQEMAVKEVDLYFYDEGRPVKQIKLQSGDTIVARFQEWVAAAVGEDGWRESRVNYAPSVVAASGNLQLNFTKNLVVLNRKRNGEWVQEVRERKPADEELLDVLRERIASGDDDS